MGKASEKNPVSGQANKPAGKPANRQAIHLLIIVVIGLLAYSNTFQSPFNLDEADFIVGNPIVRDLGYFTDISRAEGLPLYEGLRSRYIGYLSFALNYNLHGFNVTGYHIVNLAVHLINAILVYLLLLLTFQTPYFNIEKFKVKKTEQTTKNLPRFFALAAALLFVSHPIQTEAVTYVFQRLASLVSMFYLLSLTLYIKGRLTTAESEKLKVTAQKPEHSRLTPHASNSAIIWYLLSLFSAVLAMKTKENAFTLPIVITLYEFLFFSGPAKNRVLRLTPFILTMLIVPSTIIGSTDTSGEVISQVKDPVSMGFIMPTPQNYLFTQFRVIVTYIRLLFLPVNQNLDYQYPYYHSFFDPSVFISFLFLAAIFGAAVWLVYKTRSEKLKINNEKTQDAPTEGLSPLTFYLLRLVSFGIFWFFITLSVESGIIPIPMLIDEYRVYLPSVGFFIALIAGALLLLRLSSRFRALDSGFTKAAAAVFAVIVLALASATYARNSVWKDKVTLWEDVVSKNTESSRANNNLGIAYYEKGRYDDAIRAYKRAISLDPGHMNAYLNLGVVFAVTGRLNEAIENFSAVAAKGPKKHTAYINLARAYADLGQPYKAIENYQNAISINSNYAPAYQGLGTAYAKLGRLEEALATFTKFAELSPRDPDAYRNRGLVYQNMGDMANALTDFQQACSLGSMDGCELLKRASLH